MLRDDAMGNRAVTSVVAVGIAVVLTIMLAAVVTMVVLGVGEVSDGDGPSAEFEFSYDGDADPTVKDSFGNSGRTYDGLLRVTYTGGFNVEADELVLTGAASQQGRAPFARAPDFSAGERVSAGDSVTIWVSSTDEVTVSWDDVESDNSSTLDAWSGS